MRVDKRPIELAHGYRIETWYDANSRNWICQLMDPEGNQVGAAEYRGHSSHVKGAQEFLRTQALKETK